MSASGHPAVHEYILGVDESERSRLLMQSEIHRAQSERLLERFGVRRGGRVIDIGCGPLGVLDVLSTMVGDDGCAIGLDNEPRMIAHARQTIGERDLTNVELVLADGADTGIEADSLDLAHERLVLINHPAPHDIVREMTRIVCPGGWVTIEEVDTLSWTCEPAHPAWTELLEAFNGAWSAADEDPFIGRRLPALLRGAGLTDIGFDADVLIWHTGHPYQTLLLTFISMLRDRIVRGGFIDGRGVDLLVAETELHLSKPDTHVRHPLFFQAWGRKPANPSDDVTHETDRNPASLGPPSPPPRDNGHRPGGPHGSTRRTRSVWFPSQSLALIEGPSSRCFGGRLCGSGRSSSGARTCRCT
jgi:ubiquinone/menaquinone biosynthesis C-methylase UbiE